MSDLSFEQYLAKVQQRCSIQGWQHMFDQIKPSPKYHERQPVDFTGITLMTPMGHHDSHATELYEYLAHIQSDIHTHYASYFISIPAHTFHITAADLIAGPRFAQHSSHYDSDNHYIQNVRNALQTLPLSSSHINKAFSSASSCTWSLYGFTLFETALVALLVPANVASYQAITQVRHTIYTDKTIQKLGISHPLPFMAHVTLAYFDHTPSHDLLEDLTHHLLSTTSDQITYQWSSIQLHQFPHMEAYQALPFSIHV